VIVSLGPGSYTGLRVGIMSAQALAFASGCRVVGVPTFHAIARQAVFPGAELEVIADARQSKLYVQAFARATAVEVDSPTGELCIVPGRMWAEQRRPDLAVTGPGVRVAQDYLPAETPVAPAEQWEPSLRSLLHVGWKRFARGESEAVIALEPIYLRPSSAEEQWQRLGR
jgi:tRNA threonylcarbamoyladenosine biosynthesis protein TsaB